MQRLVFQIGPAHYRWIQRQRKRFSFIKNSSVVIAAEVRDAVLAGAPVVALESTIISHGLPYPRNLEVATELEQIVRRNGGVPATTAIIDGVPRVGLSAAEIEFLAENKDARKIVKASHRDMGFICAQRLNAATTVASTMVLADLAGIRVFATGGIGGVHRGAEHTMDISADLTALSRTAVTVVSSGVKSILDIPKTLEVLETLGVPVCAYKTKEFPGFFTNVTGCPSPMVVNSPVEAALMMYHSKQLGLPNGMLVAVPNPAPTTSKGSLDDRSMARMIEEAVREAAAKEISGAAITPYLLSKVAELTGGHSVDSNVALVCNNAVVATMIASEYSKLMLNDTGRNDSIIKHTSYPTLRKNAKLTASDHVIVIGGMVIDHVVRPLPKNDNGSVQELIMGTSNPGIASQTFGGVGRNIAEAVAVASREGSGTVSVSMVSAIGDDAHGALLLRHSSDIGLDVAHVLSIPGSRTATYTAVHDHHGDLTVAIADMAVLKDIPVTAARQFLSSSSSFKRSIVVADANLSISAFKAVGDFLQADPHIMFFEPTSVPKCTLPIVANCFNQINIVKPNVDELLELVKACRISRNGKSFDIGLDSRLSIDNINALAMELTGYMAKECHVLVSMGAEGILWCSSDGQTERFPALPISNPDGRSLVTNGAGDAFSGGFVFGISGSAPQGQLTREMVRAAIGHGLIFARRRILANCGLTI